MSIIGNAIMVGGGSTPPTPSGYQVIWLDWDNTILSIQTYAQGATPSYPSSTPTRTNTLTHSYTFNEWTPTITTVSEDIVYKATYTTTVTGCVEFSSDDEFSLSKSVLWDGTIEYLNNNTTWTTWDGSQITSSLNSEGVQTIALRGINNTYVKGSALKRDQFIVQASKSISLTGKIECLLNYQMVLNNQHPTMAENSFEYLFANFQWLHYIDKNLLSATTLTSYCYSHMFDSSGIFEVPNLSATTLATYCYQQIFYQCMNLTKIPNNLLPATSLKGYCYSGMFYGCQNLRSLPNNLLSATTLATYCYYQMFYNCTSITSIPAGFLPATTLSTYCYMSMFYGCTGLTSIPSNLLSATALQGRCYQYMFANCSNITNIPNLPATTLQTYCYAYMFQNCTSLVHLPTGLFKTLKTLSTYCCRYMFQNCTNLVDLVALPVTALKNYCYQYMFSGCSLIKLSTTQVDEYQTAYRIPSSGTGTTATSALSNMFSSTGGTFTGTATINTTYYTSNTVIS